MLEAMISESLRGKAGEGGGQRSGACDREHSAIGITYYTHAGCSTPGCGGLSWHILYTHPF